MTSEIIPNDRFLVRLLIPQAKSCNPPSKQNIFLMQQEQYSAIFDISTTRILQVQIPQKDNSCIQLILVSVSILYLKLLRSINIDVVNLAFAHVFLIIDEFNHSKYGVLL